MRYKKEETPKLPTGGNKNTNLFWQVRSDEVQAEIDILTEMAMHYLVCSDDRCNCSRYQQSVYGLYYNIKYLLEDERDRLKALGR